MARIFATNNLGLAASFQPFIEPMRQRGSGTLVGIASVAGIRGLPGHGAYCASKAAVISYCESLRGELRGSGVRVVTLLPGYVDTPLTRGNRYPMPFLMAPEAFARRAQRVIAAGASYRVIPWPMGVVARLLRLLPNALFDRLPAGAPRKARQAGPKKGSRRSPWHDLRRCRINSRRDRHRLHGGHRRAGRCRRGCESRRHGHRRLRGDRHQAAFTRWHRRRRSHLRGDRRRSHRRRHHHSRRRRRHHRCAGARLHRARFVHHHVAAAQGWPFMPLMAA
jgi:hypothetical protein